MRKLGLISWESGTGQTTVAANLAMGLTQHGRRVIIINPNQNMRIFHWLNTTATTGELCYGHIYSSSWGIDFIYPDDNNIHLLAEKLSSKYDYAILNIGNNKLCCGQSLYSLDLLIACTRLQSPNECRELIQLQSKIRQYRRDNSGFDLLLPLQIHSGEWAVNSQRLFELAEAFGDDKIADYLPHCERIHDLFLQRKFVWNIPQPAIIDAFDRMLERVEQLT
ncbi:MAG: hypothetical protein VB084_03450 [Syntrophomonadaceae bacterium]|nr:hypothetical protein [Syntrophomonadaceae bacterium]